MKLKRNKLTRMASVLFALTLVSTSVVSGTFAKYVTTGGTDKQEARVAKWGVVISGSGTLYSDAYVTENGGNTPATWTSDSFGSGNSQITVAAKVKGDNIVAPGTQSADDGISISLTGAPEVTTTIKLEVSAQDIYLAEGTYGTVEELAMNANRFYNEKGTTLLYKRTGNAASYTYTQVQSTDTFDPTATYCYLSGKVTVGASGYYPVNYTFNSTNNKKATEIADSFATTFVGQTSVGTSDTPSKTDEDESTAGVSYSITKTFNPNTDLKNFLDASATNNNITWVWEYEVNGTEDVYSKAGSYTDDTEYFKENSGSYESVGKPDDQEAYNQLVTYYTTLYTKSTSSTGTADENIDLQDTILGNLAAGSTVAVVDGTSLKVLSVDSSTGVVTNGGTEYGSVKTSFSIDITATQVD